MTRRRLVCLVGSLAWTGCCLAAAPPPSGLAAFAGDRSAIVAWNRSLDPTVATYAVYGSAAESGPFTLLAEKLLERVDWNWMRNGQAALTMGWKPESGFLSNLWGLTACDGPGTGGIAGYNARGAPPAQNDDGTLAPTAVGGSLPFAPEICLPTLRRLYDTYRQTIWTPFGFRDAFNLRVNWWDPDTLGIDQGPIVLMIENYRTQNLWRRSAAAPEIQRGLARAGFQPVVFVSSGLAGSARPGGFDLQWPAKIDQRYQVEYSPDLKHWFAPAGNALLAGGPVLGWSDPGAPAVTTHDQRFYRVFQFGP